MQLMTWPFARLGSRFGFLFEPGHRRVMHSALGRFLDEPLDLAVGLIEPDGTERVFPFTQEGSVLYNCEQFERMNSVTFRGYSESCGLRLELNFHSPFYPQNEKLCLMPAVFVELRAHWTGHVRLRTFNKRIEQVRLFVRLKRPNTQIDINDGGIDLNYEMSLSPRYMASCGNDTDQGSTENVVEDSPAPQASVKERIQSLNADVEPVYGEDGSVGLTLELPVVEPGHGTKWRLVWGAHSKDQILNVSGKEAYFRYTEYWPRLEAVMKWAVDQRDDHLALSRRFEKLFEQVPLNRAQWHLLINAFHSFMSNTFWCDLADGTQFFSVWEGNFMYHNTLDVAYNSSLFYFTLWPDLLRMQLERWVEHCTEHPESGGLVMNHDMGRGIRVEGQAYDHPMPVEENSNFLLLLQAYVHWTGDAGPARRHDETVHRLAEYLHWTDTNNTGFPAEGTANTLDDAAHVVQYAAGQTYLAIKRTTAMDAAVDMLERAVDPSAHQEVIEKCRLAAAEAAPKIERAAWLEDHYAVCVNPEAGGVEDGYTRQQVDTNEYTGWDDYSIYTTNGLLLPLMIAQPVAFDKDRLTEDIQNSHRETLRAYGCAHSSSDYDNIRISQNLWRDLTARYLKAEIWGLDTRYWDLLLNANTGPHSFGFCDTYLPNEICFHPRGVTAFGHLLAGPRLVIDRLDNKYISVYPDRHRPARWPLLPLADWSAGKIPVCVISSDGGVSIEGEIEPVKILEDVSVGEGLIG